MHIQRFSCIIHLCVTDRAARRLASSAYLHNFHHLHLWTTTTNQQDHPWTDSNNKKLKQNITTMPKTKGGKGKASATKTKHTPYKRPAVQERSKKRATTTTAAASATTIVVKSKAAPPPPPPPLVPFDWKNVFILGLKLHDPAKKVLLQGDYTFPNIHQLIAEHHPGCDAFVYNCPECSSSSEVELSPLSPTLVAILVPSGVVPPCFIARPSPQQGTSDVCPMKDVNLYWKEDITLCNRAGGGRMFTLQCSLQRTTKSSLSALGEKTLRDFEYLTPYINKTSIQAAEEPLVMFEVTLPNGEGVDLTFCPSETSKTRCIQEILREFAEEGLNENNPEHFNLVKAAIDQAEKKQLDELQTKKDLMADYKDETLEAMNCIKIYPNEFPGSMHHDYVNPYYMKAIATYPLRGDAAAATMDTSDE